MNSRDVIGEIIDEDNAAMRIPPAAAEFAVRELAKHTAPSDAERVAELELLNDGLWRKNEELGREVERLNSLVDGAMTVTAALMDEVARLNSSPGSAGEKCVHTEHCCKDHGCKYGDEACPVVNGVKAQSFPCEDCTAVAACTVERPCIPCFSGSGQCAGGVDERAAFEAAYAAEFNRVRSDVITADDIASMRDGEGYGARPYLNGQWIGWQARAALTASAPNHSEQVREFGFGLVAEVKYTGYEPANTLNWIKGCGLHDLLDGTKLYAESPGINQVSARIADAEQEHGSLRAAAKALGIDAGYLSRLKSGEKLNPGDDVLSALGLERVTIYRAAAPSAGSQKGEV